MNLPGIAPAVLCAATFSPCRSWRYTLSRVWNDGGTRCVFVMLNPSTADETKNDPTVAKCIRYARGWGHGSLLVLNIFAWRSTDPRVLPTLADPIGPENDEAIRAGIAGAARVICAWGKWGRIHGRGPQVLALIRAAGVTPYALSLNNDGSCAHPLYLPGAATPQPMPDPKE